MYQKQQICDYVKLEKIYWLTNSYQQFQCCDREYEDTLLLMTDSSHVCLQSVTRNLSLGGEVFWAGQHRKSGIGYAARYNTDKMVIIFDVQYYSLPRTHISL